MADDASVSIDPIGFRRRYGPWAVISGASDGTGAAYAQALAAAGLNLVLIARRPAPLQALAADLETRFGVETRAASVDLYQPGAGQRVLAAADGLEVGLYISNAGADTNGHAFLDAPLQAWRDLINRNVTNLVEAVYGFAGPMRARGRGGLILMSSGTALGGQAKVAVYSASKAFDLNFAESLWMELKPHGVAVIGAVAPAMDTPSLRRLLDGRDIPGLHDPASVARTMIERLEDGPSYVFAFGPDAPQAGQITEARRKRVETVSSMSKLFFGEA
jgi:short-subunit dehydrogenase